MLQYTIPAAQSRVNMEQSVGLSSLDTYASAQMIIMEPTVIVSIVLWCILKLKKASSYIA